MADYYTKPESDVRFAPYEHTHILEELGGTELPANRVGVPESVSADFGDAFTLDEALVSIAGQMAGKASANHSHTGYSPSTHTHAPASIGAAAADHSHDYAAPTHTHAQADVTGLVNALAAKADLVGGKVPASQLPSYVSDVAEYASLANFPATGESNKIYVSQNDNKTYRWGGSAYVEISASLALGETAATAFRGDHGKAAYDHSQNGDVHVTAAQKAAWNAKSDFSGSYNDLTDKPTIPTIPASLPANGGDADTVDGKHASDFAPAAHDHTVFSGSSASTYKLVYVGPDGSDDNTGFSSGAPMATIKGVIRKYAEKHKMLDIRLLDGTYNEDPASGASL